MTYIDEFRESLRRETEALNAEHLQLEARKDLELKLFKETSATVTERLKRLIESIPLSERYQPRSLEWYRSRLRGIQGRGAHAGEVGNALRALGHSRKRAWSYSEDGFRALWYPPDKNISNMVNIEAGVTNE